MSVINQMLRDLEHRRAQSFAVEGGLLNDLDAAEFDEVPPVSFRERFAQWLPVIILFAVATILLGLIVTSPWKTRSLTESVSSPLVVPLSGTAQASQPLQQADHVEKHVASEATTPVAILPATVPESVDSAVQVADADSVTTAQVYQDIQITSLLPASLLANGQRQRVTLQGSGFSDPLRVTMEWAGGNGFKELEAWQVRRLSSTELELNINLGWHTDNWLAIVEQLETGKFAEYRFNVKSARQPQVAATGTVTADVKNTTRPVSGMVNKQKRVMSQADKVRVAYAEASLALQQGNNARAEKTLRDVLGLDFTHLQARQTLAAMLFRAQRYDEAAAVLETGRIQHPSHIPFSLLLARIHTERGQDPQAIVLLESLSPAVATNSDYYALLAALYERSAQHAKAAAVYEKLLASYPGRAVWWMGLGLSRQSLNLNSDAVVAYNRALAAQGLTAELRSFIQSRLGNLQPR